MNYINTFYIAYCELLGTSIPFIFIHFYVFIFIALHLVAKYCKCIGLLDEYIQETIMDDVSSDESTEDSNIIENISEEYTDEINDQIDMVVRYEKLYNIVDLIIGNYIPMNKYRKKISLDFMSEHDINVYGTIYEWGSFCQNLNRFELDYFIENLVTYVGLIDGRFKHYLKKYRNEIERDYHHFLLNINNLKKTTLFTPDYNKSSTVYTQF